jgi:hypothetical protein
VLGWVIILVAVLATVALGAGREDAFDLVLYGPLTMVLATSGMLICARHPRHPVGRLFWVLGGWFAIAELGEAYSVRAAVADWPAGEVGEWVIAWSWLVDFALWSLILLRFPDGGLPSRRWRPVPWVVVAGAALAVPGYALGTGAVEQQFADGRNPFAVEALPTALMSAVGMALLAAGGFTAVAATMVRLRRSSGIERLQMKWFAAAAALVAAVGPFAVWLWYETFVVRVAMGLALISVPVAAGIAILRYRLYDIDLVIRRTLVYAALTATLALAYLTTVLLAQLVVPARSDLTTAVSTLAAAAVLRPARARIQRIVDRRFFRRRYDRERTLEAFGLRLRDEVDIATLSVELEAVTVETLQPAHVSLWLREPHVTG